LDYVPAFTHIRQEVEWADVPKDRAGGGLVAVSGEEYNSLRDRLLDGKLYAGCSDRLVEFQQGLAQACGGDIYRLMLPSGDGCAVVEPDGEQVVIKELLCAEEDTNLALALLAERHPAKKYVLRLPPWSKRQGEQVTWGAVRWLYDRPSPWWPEGAQGYLGLAFD
jgi:hypothetical protein